MKKIIRNFLALSSLTTIAIYIINKIISFSSSLKNLLSTNHGRFYDWRYGKIYYTKKGKGSPILLIHDLNPMSSAFEWDKICKHLSRFYTVYTIDLLGCGRSQKPNLTYTNYMYVQLITDFVKNMIGEKTDLVSMGSSGSFTVMACNMNPEYFKKLILINPEDINFLSKIPNKRKNALKLLTELPIIGTLIYNILYSSKGIEHQFFQKYYYKNYLVSTRILDTYYESSHLDNSRGKYLLSSMNANYTNINIVHALKKIDNSIFIICSNENEVLHGIADSYTFYNSSIETSFIKNSKFIPQLETPDALFETLRLFLES